MSPKTRCTRGTEAELAEIAEFAVGVFNVDFPNYLPRLYRPGAGTGHNHFIVREDDGNIAAAVINYPLDATVGENVIPTYGIGTVSVGVDSRGKGYMTDLLTECVVEAAENGAAFSILSGQRQRYEYYGYARIGEATDFCMTLSSARHAIPKDTPAYSLRPATQDDGDALVAMMKTRPVYATRTADDFLYAVAADYRAAYIVNDGKSDVGYFVSSKDFSSVSEIVLLEGANIDSLVLALLERRDTVMMSVPAHETALYKRLYDSCNSWTTGAFANVCVLDFPKTLAAYGDLLLASREINETGSFTIGIEAHPFLEKIGVAKEGLTHGTFEIRLTDDKRVSVKASDRPADITLPYLRALEFIFGRIGDTYPSLPTSARELFPLPFYFPKSDMV